MKDDIFLEHNAGTGHIESPGRLEIIYEGLAPFESLACFDFPAFEPAAKEILEMVHSEAHIDRLAGSAGSALSLDADTGTSARSYEAACMAAGAVVKGAEMLSRGEVANVFALVRPPGHHAETDRAMGFCLFNNVAIAAAYAINELGYKRIMIVDWDLHHGNGSQRSFYATDKVLYFSTHMYPYYPGTGALYEIGSGSGKGYNVNVPLSRGMNDKAYAAVFNQVLAPIARQYQPEMIMISAGYDIHHGDPLGTMVTTEVGFAYLTRVLKQLSEELCDGRLLLTLEGGYNLEGLRDGVLATLGEMTGTSFLQGVNEKADSLQEACFGMEGGLQAESLETLRNAYKDYWEI